MDSPTPPAPPDPVKTAEAQRDMNVKTATNQQQLNMVDQVTPYGNLNYKQVAKWDDGTPHFQSTTTLAPEEATKLAQQREFGDIVNKIGISQAGKIGGLLGTPLKLGNEATESRLMELGRARLDPMLADRRAALETQLYNKGVREGTKAYDDAMLRDQQSANDAYNDLLLRGRSAANTEILAERNQPINETTALMRGGQVTQPQFGNTPQANVNGVDLAGLTMDAYKYGPLAQYQAEQQQNQALMSGLFSVAGAGLGGWGMGGFKGFGRT